MTTSFRISSLVPKGLVVESVNELEYNIKVTVQSAEAVAACPSCGVISRRVHSRYNRQVADLPCTGRGVALSVITRRFAPVP
jgi:transposase